MTVRTRFAPSPTGQLHIGGVRTALFNWLFSRQQGGQFLLRIDDTDQQRNLQDALQPILDGFRWLGIDWDEGPEVGGPHAPYFQSQRADRHCQAVQRLLDAGAAYRDFARPEEIQAEREAAEREQRSFCYSRRWMAEDDDQAARLAAEGRQAVVRLKMPRSGTCQFHDLVRGEVQVEWAAEQDHVIQRADGSCLYHLASVVDDHQMQITHVIRAVEHLSNTPRQLFIARSLGYDPPVFAHLPFVAEPGSANKLSKRKLQQYLKQPDFRRLYAHGERIVQTLGLAEPVETFNPVLVDFYRQVGYLPAALNNYLLLLGWSLDDRREDFSRQAMIEHFSLERINRAPARFDPQKLMAIEERYMRALSREDKLALVLPYLERAGWLSPPIDQAARGRVAAIVQAAGDRIKVAGDILDYGDFFTPDDKLAYDPAAWKKRLVKPPGAADLLARFRHALAAAESFEPADLEQRMQEFVAAEEIQLGQIIHAVRVAVTGKAVGFGLFETLAILGPTRCLARIDRALEQLAPPPE